jgi:hypothetical protein
MLMAHQQKARPNSTVEGERYPRSLVISGRKVPYHYNHRVGLFWAEIQQSNGVISYQAKSLESLEALLMRDRVTQATP